MKSKVGIVVVSHNASLAVRMTLASLRQAKNETPFELLLVDNASKCHERKTIKTALERHVGEAGLAWRYLQFEENLGFSGGNNVGIETFLKDENITHICLLNSDVIVCDFWLDRLLENKYDVVSPVTNKSDSTQAIPVDYKIDFSGCLDSERELINPSAYKKINRFSQQWYTAWQGNNFVTQDEVTFFCALLTRDIVQRVGLLDTAFFPGGFEDFDYCKRVRSVDGKICLVRDVFIHHWGSASFGKISREAFTENAARNKKYLEEKHKLVWESHPQAPFISYRCDLFYALNGGGEHSFQKAFINLYQNALRKLLGFYTKEYKALRKELEYCYSYNPEELSKFISRIELSGNVVHQFLKLNQEVQVLLKDVPADPVVVLGVAKKMHDIEKKVKDLASCNLKMSSLINECSGTIPESQRRFTILKFMNLIKKLVKGFSFFIHLKGIVVFGGYPYDFRENDGYFQRIKAVDGIIDGRTRIYIDRVNHPKKKFWFDKPAPNVIVINIEGKIVKKLITASCALLCILRTRLVYFHSILPMRKFTWVMGLPFLIKIIDFHGVVPEEFFYNGDVHEAKIFGKIEKKVVKKADHLIVVTKAMQRHIEEKYDTLISGQFITLPIFSERLCSIACQKDYSQNEQPVIVYAGGLQKWQQIPKMIEAIKDTAGDYRFKIFSPEPEKVKPMLPESLTRSDLVEIDTKTHDELIREYREANFGFILREDTVVNRVACPTKLIEYLAMGIIPIVDYEDIGDFKALGMSYIRLSDLLEKNIPKNEAFTQMITTNHGVFTEIMDIYIQGVSELIKVLKITT